MYVVVESHERAERSYQVARALQTFVGRTLDMDPAYLLRAVRLLAREIPDPRSLSEKDDLRKALAECAFRAAMRCHREYHRSISPEHCATSHLETVAALWADRSADPRRALRCWARAFVDVFSTTHPWPAAVRAAMILRKQRRRWVGLEGVCRALAVSRSALTRSFRVYYGMSLVEYHRRAKLRWMVDELRHPDSNVESVALRAGYKSPASSYQALRSQTGLMPSEIRVLADTDYRELMDGALALSRQVWPRRA